MRLQLMMYFCLCVLTSLLFLILNEESALGAALICWSVFTLPECFRLVVQVTSTSKKDLALHDPVSHVSGLLQGLNLKSRRLEQTLSRCKSKILLTMLIGLAAVIMVKSLAPGPGFSLQQAGFFILLAVSFWGAQTLPLLSLRLVAGLVIAGGSAILLIAFGLNHNILQANYGALFILWSILSLTVSQLVHKPKHRSAAQRYLMQI